VLTRNQLGVRHFSRFLRSGLSASLCRYSFAIRRNLKRYYGAGRLHLITCSCYRRQPLLGTPRRRHLLLTVLEQVRQRYEFVVVGCVVMPEHIHLLISEPQKKNPSTVMQALKLSFARRVLAQARRRRNPSQASLFEHAPEHVWQKRFYDFNVWTEHKRIEKLRYKHRNPVKRGLVVSPELWRWRRFRAYFLREAGRVRVNGWEVLKMRMPPRPRKSGVTNCWLSGKATSQKAREVAYPQLFRANTQRQPALYFPR